MSYLGHTSGIDFCQAHDTVFMFVFGRWVRFCGWLEWFDTIPGRLIRKVLSLNGIELRLNPA